MENKSNFILSQFYKIRKLFAELIKIEFKIAQEKKFFEIIFRSIWKFCLRQNVEHIA